MRTIQILKYPLGALSRLGVWISFTFLAFFLLFQFFDPAVKRFLSRPSLPESNHPRLIGPVHRFLFSPDAVRLAQG